MEQAEKQNAAIKTYSAKDYVKDGLVALWDGIENAGWHTHDPTVSVWKDLVGKREIEIKPGRFASDGYHRDERDGALIVPASVSECPTWEIVFSLQNSSTNNLRIIGLNNSSTRYEVDGGANPKLRFYYKISSSASRTSTAGQFYGNGMYFLSGSISQGLPL